MAKQDKIGWLLRESYSLLKQYIIPLIASAVGGVIMLIIAFFFGLPLIAKIPFVLLTAAIVLVLGVVFLKIVWAYQDRKNKKEYGKVVSRPGKRGKRRRWQERVQQLIDSAPSSGDREEAVKWRDEVLEVFENFRGSQNPYGRMLLERTASLEKDADVSECVGKALDYLGDIKESEF